MGLLHSHLNVHWISFDEVMCQRPKRAFFIYTNKELVNKDRFVKCVNALNGLFHLHGKEWCNGYSKKEKWQRSDRVFFIHTQCLGEPRLIYSVNALNELSSFTLGYDLNVMVSTEVCQSPNRAFFIYTEFSNPSSELFKLLCQRPNRAFFIYTQKRSRKFNFSRSVSTPYTGFLHLHEEQNV